MDPTALTLRAWYNAYVLPVAHGTASPRTREAYAETLNHWERLSSNPPLAAATNLDLATWREKLAKRPIKPATVNKHIRHLNYVFALAGPPARSMKHAAGLLDRPPWAAPVTEYHDHPQPPTINAVLLMYRAASPWWRSYIATALHSGSRRAAILSLDEPDVDWPNRLGRFAAAADKRRTARYKPLSRCVLRHLASLRGNRPLLKWTNSKCRFYDVWHRIQRRAHLTDDQKFLPHDLKRLCGTLLAELGASPWAVRYQLDHKQTDVTGLHYVNPINELSRHVENLPSLDELADRREPTAANNQITITYSDWV